MTDYDTRQNLANKIEWEGGIYGALEYGITAGDINQGDTELVEAWTSLEEAYRAFEAAAGAVEALLPDNSDSE